MATKTKTTKTQTVIDTDLFGSAAVEVKVVKKKSAKPTVAVSENLDILAWMDTVIDTVSGARAFYEAEVKLEARKIYIDRGMQQKSQPENLSLMAPEESTASAEFRKRSSMSKLTDEQIAVLEANSIPYETAVIKEEHYFFNPELINNPATRQAISKALANVPELKNQQVLMKQEKEVKYIVADESLNRAFAQVDKRSMLEAILDIVSVAAIKVKSNVTVAQAIEKLQSKGLADILGRKA